MDYIRMHQLSLTNHGTGNLVSEVLSYEEAVCFAEVFHHNYKVHTEIASSYEPKKYVVFAYNVELRLVQSNYRKDLNEFEFANWKYVTR